MWYAGDDVACNICGMTARKFQQGPETGWELMCPYCYSRPRHRTAYRFFHERTDLFDGRPKRMLHVAPEAALAPKFRAIPGLDYLSGDLDPAAAMVQMDITDIHYPDNSFDVIYCSHVLEHVPEDRRAMRELARVLKPGGWAVSAVRKTRTGSSGNRIMCAGIARQISGDDLKRRDSRSRWIDLRSSSVMSS
jgi:SAM-dependent methyltransferase